MEQYDEHWRPEHDHPKWWEVEVEAVDMVVEADRTSVLRSISWRLSWKIKASLFKKLSNCNQLSYRCWQVRVDLSELP